NFNNQITLAVVMSTCNGLPAITFDNVNEGGLAIVHAHGLHGPLCIDAVGFQANNLPEHFVGSGVLQSRQAEQVGDGLARRQRPATVGLGAQIAEQSAVIRGAQVVDVAVAALVRVVELHLEVG